MKHQKNNIKKTNKAVEKNIHAKPSFKEKPKEAKKRGKNSIEFFCKTLLLIGISIGSIAIGENSKLFEPDNTNNHTERKWKSFYKFTEKDTVDIIIIGTSKAYTGINPNNLSMALGANAFVLASPATSMMDGYYCLREALLRTKPKVVLIDSYRSSPLLNKDFVGSPLSAQYQSFKARKNIKEKFTSMNTLFRLDNIPAAWSNTIRNHNYIFRDTLQIKKNKILRTLPEKKDTSIYLGRFIRFTTGISDSVMALYDSLGAPVKAENVFYNEEYKEYSQKIVQLCNDNGIIPVFITYPLYYRHIDDNSIFHKKTEEIINKTGARWIDFQQNYTEIANNRLCFENTYDENQHMTRIGSYLLSYKIAAILKDSFKIDLPHRDKSQRWHNMFYDSEGYIENYPVRENDKKNILFSKGFHDKDLDIIEAYYNNEEKTRIVFVKIAKDNLNIDIKKSRINILVKGNYKGQETAGWLNLAITGEYSPFNHHLLISNVIKDFVPLEIIGLRID